MNKMRISTTTTKRNKKEASKRNSGADKYSELTNSLGGFNSRLDKAE